MSEPSETDLDYMRGEGEGEGRKAAATTCSK
jgi:hypothetical protein